MTQIEHMLNIRLHSTHRQAKSSHNAKVTESRRRASDQFNFSISDFEIQIEEFTEKFERLPLQTSNFQTSKALNRRNDFFNGEQCHSPSSATQREVRRLLAGESGDNLNLKRF